MAAVFLMCGIYFSAPASAQVTGGTISGTITDPSDRYGPQAQVSIVNFAKGITTTVMTNSDGFYTAPNPFPRENEIPVSAKGFSTEVPKGISPTVGGRLVLH